VFGDLDRVGSDVAEEVDELAVQSVPIGVAHRLVDNLP
jgi:hypothetical protein